MAKSKEDFQELPDEKLPPFFKEMADRFISQQSNQFFLSGNVDDLIDGRGIVTSYKDQYAPDRYCYLEQYISTRLEHRGRFVITFNIARGISFSSNEAYNELREFYMKGDAAGLLTNKKDQEKRALRFDRYIAESQVYSFLTLRFLEELCKLCRMRREEAVGKGLSIIIKHAEMLLPAAPTAQMSDVDRQKLTLLREWFNDPEFLSSMEQVILIAPTVSSVHETVRQLPHLTLVNIPLPEEKDRKDFIHWMHKQTGREIKLRRSQKELANLTAGMTYLTLQNLFLQAKHKDGELDENDILQSLNKLLMSELGDKIEVVRPGHTMNDVIGASAMKEELSRLQKLMASRDPSLSPVGILVAGPNGVGKTFIFEAWAAECDRLVIVLKNLRSMYFGQTDVIFEKLRNVLEALGNVIIFIDEADTMFAKPGRNTHATEARLFGNLIRMMGEPKNRGRIVWLLLTARPDNLAPDLKRSGRAGLHLPVFDPEGKDREAYLKFILKRAGVKTSAFTEDELRDLMEATSDLSPAAFNELLSELRAEKYLEGDLDVQDILQVIGNQMPGQIAEQRRIQTLQAYMECSRKSLLPPSLASKSRGELELELEQLLARRY